jgi:Trk K+ transport system NAD-binding subunit
LEISSKIRPLRDFFLIIFFIILGLNIPLTNIGTAILKAIAIAIAAFLIKAFVLMSLMALFGHTKRTNFLVGTTLAQISEFSFIILALGVSVGDISSNTLHTVTLAGIMTIAISTYFMIYSQKIYDKTSWLVSFFEKKNIKKERKLGKKYKVILFGYNRIGFSVLKTLKNLKKNYLVVDFNPDAIKELNKLKVDSLYGDAYDSDLLNDLPLETSELIVSTVPEVETTELLIKSVRAVNKNVVVIVRASTIHDALNFYKQGADYVLTPHFLGGEYVANMIGEIKTDKAGYKVQKDKHVAMLLERKKKGDE